ncbi:NADH-quinone oxidoreductase subunit NuoE [Pelagibacterales bacterium]|jgi:NADH-quinone oxidoreductase E subunit|nr:NADH-quinone oxidoreductase subunit NuoE [Pelagibacterales bacterium]MDB9986280.1 NADH-quinone oxidoreductase subunit NuoE [Pelagibacterales bacterium]|tara:strand:+ start:1707 stop:2258 length:552 start_codon:yes stop_codon:yes gene_type:complete
MSFTFNEKSNELAKIALAKYPDDRKQSAVMPFLDIAQRQNNNWLSQECIEYVADQLEMPFIKVWEIVTFYTMYNTQPVGKNFVQVCTTTPCWLRGSEHVVRACKEIISENPTEVSSDNLFSWMEVECLGACVNAPMVQINDDFYEDLNYESTKNLLLSLIDNKPLQVGSQIGRQGSKGVSDVK